MLRTKLNGARLGGGVPGSLTLRLIAAWNETVGGDIVAQAEEYAERAVQM